jgi:hypothetical protein
MDIQRERETHFEGKETCSTRTLSLLTENEVFSSRDSTIETSRLCNGENGTDSNSTEPIDSTQSIVDKLITKERMNE